jgi:hypothetical protein
LSEQFAKSNELQERIRVNLAKIGIELWSKMWKNLEK